MGRDGKRRQRVRPQDEGKIVRAGVVHPRDHAVRERELDEARPDRQCAVGAPQRQTRDVTALRRRHPADDIRAEDRPVGIEKSGRQRRPVFPRARAAESARERVIDARIDATAKALLRWAAAEREAWLEAVTNDPLLPGRILPSDYLGQQARWPSARTGGGWKCSGTPAANCTHSNPHSPVQTFVAYTTKVRHGLFQNPAVSFW